MKIRSKDKVKKIHGIDISPKMIDAAKRKASENKIENINFIQSTIFDERFNKESFDVIIGFNILHLLQDLPAVIHRINTLLKPGGLFISVTPCLGQKKSFLSTSLAFLNKIKIVPKINFFKISDIEDLISHGHFQIVEMETLSDAIPNQCIVAKKI